MPPLLVAFVCANLAARPTSTDPRWPWPNGTLLIQRDTRTLHYWNGGMWLNAATGA